MRNTSSTRLDPLPDPVTELLVARWGLGPLRFALLLEGLVIASVFAGLLITWLLRGGDAASALLHHYAKWETILYAFLLTPAIPAFSVWIVRAGPQTIEQLINRNLASTRDEACELAIQAQRIYRSHVWALVGVIVTGLAFAANFVSLLVKGQTYVLGGLFATDNLANATPAFVASTPVTVLAWYLVCITVAMELCTIRALRRLFAATSLRLDPLHPDRCGGLRVLSLFALRFTYLIALCGCGLAILAYSAVKAGTLRTDLLLQFGMLAYVVLAPTCFFATLGSAHSAMKKEKNHLLASISERFRSMYDQLQTRMRRDEFDLEHEVARIEQIRKLYALTERFPVWPFDAQSLRRFAAAVLSPVIPVALSIVRDWIVGNI